MYVQCSNEYCTQWREQRHREWQITHCMHQWESMFHEVHILTAQACPSTVSHFPRVHAHRTNMCPTFLSPKATAKPVCRRTGNPLWTLDEMSGTQVLCTGVQKIDHSRTDDTKVKVNTDLFPYPSEERAIGKTGIPVKWKEICVTWREKFFGAILRW